MIQQSLFY